MCKIIKYIVQINFIMTVQDETPSYQLTIGNKPSATDTVSLESCCLFNYFDSLGLIIFLDSRYIVLDFCQTS